MNKKYHVPIFNMCECMDNPVLHRFMLDAEERVQKDGYKIQCEDGAGFFTFVEFDTLAEAIEFKLRYL